jgi:hypothetical protein
MSQDQNAGQSYNIKTDFNSFIKVEEFSHLRTSLTYQNSIQEEINLLAPEFGILILAHSVCKMRIIERKKR